MQHASPQFRPRSRDGVSRRTARGLGWSGIALAIAVPAIVWRRPIAAVASGFQWNLTYLVMGWTGYALIAAGVLFMLPVVISIGLRPDSRLYPRSRNAYAGWATTLYLLGCAIATQVAQIADGPGDP